MADEPARRPSHHPRRPPAHKSVSLRHSAVSGPQLSSALTAAQRRSRVPSSNQANPPFSSDSKEGTSSVDSKPANAKDSSGESSNAERWFEKSNNQVKANASNGGDSEPPFFLRNSSSSETPPDVAQNRRALLAAQSPAAPPRAHELARMETTGSSSEDFRSVIDDLTVENKKLKRKLKKYEKLYDAHLQQDKLFEIRMHGLRGAKKRELEETLRRFAMSLDDSKPKASVPADSITTSGYETSTPALEPNPTASSHTSTKFTDSAYVSNSNSGQNSLAPSARERMNRNLGKTSSSRRQDIHSYLHDIPASLLPRPPVAMTEKAKRRLVVRRLEQIFAGKGAAAGGHQQPEQQQEVSQSAAHADRMAIEASGQQARAEGIREARIMPTGETKATMDAEKSYFAPNVNLQRASSIGEMTGKDSPDQRPTRPLDLDLHRAQIPQDNIEYIRHLGFSPMDPDATKDSDEHGWIYLNVLVNMAQLHTLNVTTEFVKKSIGDHSKKFQISRDGRKVRWKGGHDVTRSSSDSSPNNPNQSPDGKSFDELAKQKSIGQLSSGTSNESPTKASTKGSSNKLAYVPLFFHKQGSEWGETTSDEHVTSWGSPQRDPLRGNSSGFTSSGMRTNQSKRKRGEDGPIIFYNKAKFCTDLSGDRNENHALQQSNVKYNPVATNPVGAGKPKHLSDDDVEDTRRRPLTATTPSEDAMDIDDVDDSDEEMEGSLKFSPKAPSATHIISSPENIHFEASGLGGVQPTDNFRIEVQSKRRARPAGATPNATHNARVKPYPPRIMEILRSGRPEGQSPGSSAIEEEVVSTREERLPASTLPPPASLFAFDSAGSDDEDAMSGSGAESDVSSLGNEDEYVPSTVPQMLHLSSNSDDDESDSDDDDGQEMDDGSVDFLAHVRQLDPMAVHECEREYDANMAEKLAEDIPAGSSAATAGGGSGFNSPASLERAGSGERRRSGSAKILVPNLKKAWTSGGENAALSAGGRQAKMD